MKKLFNFGLFVMLATFSLAFVSCEDDLEASIVGTWEITSINYYSVFDVEENEAFSVGDKIVFNADGSYSAPEDAGKYSYVENTLTLYSQNDDSDNTIYIPAKFIVQKLTSKDLVMTLDYGFFSLDINLKRVK